MEEKTLEQLWDDYNLEVAANATARERYQWIDNDEDIDNLRKRIERKVIAEYLTASYQDMIGEFARERQ